MCLSSIKATVFEFCSSESVCESREDIYPLSVPSAHDPFVTHVYMYILDIVYPVLFHVRRSS